MNTTRRHFIATALSSGAVAAALPSAAERSFSMRRGMVCRELFVKKSVVVTG